MVLLRDLLERIIDPLWGSYCEIFKSRGVKFIFTGDGSLHDIIFDKTKKVKAFSYEDIEICEFGFNISAFSKEQWTCNPNFSTGVIADIVLTDARYSNKINSSIINVEGTECLNLSTSARTVVNKYYEQYETRLIATLRSTKTIIINDDIKYLLMPLIFDQSILKIEFGERTKKEDKDEIKKLLTNRYHSL